MQINDEKIDYGKLWNGLADAKDVEGMFALNDDVGFSVSMNLMLNKENNTNEYGGYKPLSSWNHVKKTLFLCISFENLLQAEGIGGFFQYQISFGEDVVDALREIGANLSASLLQNAIVLMPKGCSFFDLSENPEGQSIYNNLRVIERTLSSYPDDLKWATLYRKYAESHRESLV